MIQEIIAYTLIALSILITLRGIFLLWRPHTKSKKTKRPACGCNCSDTCHTKP